jgi:hypothetical protein
VGVSAERPAAAAGVPLLTEATMTEIAGPRKDRALEPEMPM